MGIAMPAIADSLKFVQCLLAGACQNMKKIARLLARALLRFLIAQARARNPLGAFSALATSICQRILQRQISPSIAAPA